MKYEIDRTSKFKQDYRHMLRRGYDISLLEAVIRLLASGDPLPKEYKDHALKGAYIGTRECHITPDWLLMYKLKDNVLVLVLSRTGTHSDLLSH
jgi:mRNA interferase YafQ